jgi:hypothetical protein
MLRKWGEGYAGRTPEWAVLEMSVNRAQFRSMIHQWHIMKEGTLRVRRGDIIYRRLITEYDSEVTNRSETNGIPDWDRTVWGDCDVLRLSLRAVGDAYFRYNYQITPSQGLAVTFRRKLRLGEPLSTEPLVVDVYPITFRERATSTEGFKLSRLVPQTLTDPPTNHLHAMEIPSDSWALELEGYPGLYIRVERKELSGAANGAVDVVDFFLFPKGPEADMARRAIALNS